MYNPPNFCKIGKRIHMPKTTKGGEAIALHIEMEANRCLQCKKPLCQQNCPIHTPIPRIIGLFKEGKVMEAEAKFFQNNPL